MFKDIYKRVILEHRQSTSFIILIVFLVTFLISRIVVSLIDAKMFPDLYLYLGQTHVHHLNYGIFLLVVSGYLALVLRDLKTSHLNLLAAVFGIGLGLTFDEFSLWFHLSDTYYARISYEAIVVIAVFLINIVFFSDLWLKIFRFIFRRD